MSVLPLIYHPIYSELMLPEGHRYPIHKYRLLYQHIKKHYPASMIQWHQPAGLSRQSIEAVHDSDYIDALFAGTLPLAKMRRIGFPYSEQLIKRTCTSAAGTLLAVELALEHDIAIHLSGGYHHAHRDFGSGFCLINDLAIAANHALSHFSIDSVLIIDADVHHGDGTATITEQMPAIHTFSIHCEKNFPSRKPRSSMDVPLAKHCNSFEYLQSFKQTVTVALNTIQPDLILFDAGVDIHIGDELGLLNVCEQGIFERDNWLLKEAKTRAIPIACVIGGGYRTVQADLVPLHNQLICAALTNFT